MVTERYTVHDEVFITRLLFGELGWILRQESERGKFSAAFLEDLGAAFRYITSSHKGIYQELKRVSTGLIARIRYHEPVTEGRTGGDFGVAVVRPSVRMGKNNQLAHKLHEQGLLCQAKRQTRSRGWGSLTDKQKKVLPSRLSYTALLLYGYNDKVRQELLPFSWKSCAGHTIDEVDEWLKKTFIDDTLPSRQVICDLAAGKLGTGNQDIIQKLICPPGQAFIKLEIVWKSDFPPPPN